MWERAWEEPHPPSSEVFLMFDSAQEGQAAELHFMLHNILRTKPAKHLFSLLAHLQ